MKQEKNTTENNISVNPARKFLNKAKGKKLKKFEEFAAQNLAHIEALLMGHPAKDELAPQIEKFLEEVISGSQANLSIPENVEPGLVSLLMNNMALWLGNTQQIISLQQQK